MKDAEAKVKQVVEIWPPFKHQAYRSLAIELCKIIVDSAFREQFGYISPRSSQIRSNEIPWFITTATYYLEETMLNNGTFDNEVLLYLACMYGYQDRYNDMVRIIDRARKTGEGIIAEFRKPMYLQMLICSCGNNRIRIEELGRKIGVELPVSKEAFCRFMSNFDVVGMYPNFIQWIAIRRMSGLYGIESQSLVSIKISVLDGANV